MKTALIKIGSVHVFFAALSFIALMNLGMELRVFDFIWGAALSGSQVIFLIVLGYRVIYKKGIAFTVLLSVFKYGILLGIFVLAAAGFLRISPSFAVGFITIVPSLTSLIFLRPYILKDA